MSPHIADGTPADFTEFPGLLGRFVTLVGCTGEVSGPIVEYIGHSHYNRICLDNLIGGNAHIVDGIVRIGLHDDRSVVRDQSLTLFTSFAPPFYVP